MVHARPGMPGPHGWFILRSALRGPAEHPTEGEQSVLTVIACVALVVVGILGAVKMEDHLDPSKGRSRVER